MRDNMENKLERVMQNLQRVKGNWAKVARGAGIGYFTVVRIASGRSKHPRYETIEKLDKFFGYLP